MAGKLLILSAPSGAGKTSLARALIEKSGNTQMSISHTTRNCRVGEQDGVDYFFVEKAEFLSMVKDGKFLEHAKVYEEYYGTSRDSVIQMLNQGNNVLLDVDWQGARQVKDLMSEAISVSILPPSREELERRLHDRARDPVEVIEKRMQQARSEMSHCHEADVIILNDDFESALNDLLLVLQNKADKVRKISELNVDLDELLNA